jgi:hypothetical protein
MRWINSAQNARLKLHMIDFAQTFWWRSRAGSLQALDSGASYASNDHRPPGAETRLLRGARARLLAGRAGNRPVFVTAAMTFAQVLHKGFVRPQQLPVDLQSAHDEIVLADHFAFIFLLGSAACHKCFLERVLQPAVVEPANQAQFVKALKGESARIVVTMGLQALDRWWFGAHAVKCAAKWRSLRRRTFDPRRLRCSIRRRRRRMVAPGGAKISKQ